MPINKEYMELGSEFKITKKVKCDHCGAIFNSGLINVVNHSFECGASEEVKINDSYTAVYTPYISVTQIPDDL